MNETIPLFLAGCSGLFLGAFFFGGLWWTVRKSVTAKHPALWILGSMIARMSIVLTGFHFVGGGSWRRLLICLLGFIIARLVVVRLSWPPVPSLSPAVLAARDGGQEQLEPAVRLSKESNLAT